MQAWLSSPRRLLVLNTGLVLFALALFAVVDARTGRLLARDGLGWDGTDYAAMIKDGWDQGTASTALRPFIVFLNAPVTFLLGGLITGFHVMNYVYVAVLCLALCLLFERYNTDPAAKTFFIANAFLCIAVSKGTAYYPMSIDLGALAVIAFTTSFIVRGQLALAAVGCLASVLAREFALGVVLFGLFRGVRERVSPWTLTIVYLPALAVYWGWRAYVGWHFTVIEGAALKTVGDLMENLSLWRDPQFAAFFAYFVATVCGGISVFLIVQPRSLLRLIRQEPEWLVLTSFIMAAAAMGNADIWRYLAFLLPAIAVFFAASDISRAPMRWRVACGVLIAAITITTQRPFQRIDEFLYFREWFPYYAITGASPVQPALALWPVWGWRFLTLALSAWALAVMPVSHTESADALLAKSV